jgi:hypothetical protein
VLSVGYCKAQHLLFLARDFNLISDPFMSYHNINGWIFTCYIFSKNGQNKVFTTGYSMVGINIKSELETLEKRAYSVEWNTKDFAVRKKKAKSLWNRFINVIFKQR